MPGRDQHPPAGRVRDEAAAAAVEELHAQAVFEPGEALAEGRLADEEAFGGGREGARVSGGGEQFQIAQVHIRLHNGGLWQASFFVVV